MLSMSNDTRGSPAFFGETESNTPTRRGVGSTVEFYNGDTDGFSGSATGHGEVSTS
jgi:hypothetical protein